MFHHLMPQSMNGMPHLQSLMDAGTVVTLEATECVDVMDYSHKYLGEDRKNRS